ncbi:MULTISPECIES: glycoside hydrolase family 108 protein [Acinetobacter]|uniref:Uncharacterized protein n=1 Tax=Acinetobacter guerrae TaxID=1843371 RepID=A0A3A8E5G4_9GAMM|nr:glycosyl hydrolase 108 family protein [Acinetobacter guerrae]RKG29865.1 hypothetical protein D7V21_16865 [Acinetobacter guerrae]
MAKGFQDALKRVLKHEGGYVNHPSDPGGETNYGITKSTAKQFGYNGSMKNIPIDVVESIYKEKYWTALSCDQYTFALAFQLFDAGVNHGLGNARRILQRAVGVADDGVIGKTTIAAIQKIGGAKTVDLFNAERILFYTKLSTFNTFGKGWMNRMVENLRFAVEDFS